MTASDLPAALSALMAKPFIPELHDDDCPDTDCPGCARPQAPARPRQQEDPHDGPLATHYKLSRDMPEVTR